jgi:hypothetical protein
VPYRNPVIRGFHPDPSVCRVGGDFYLVTSSFEYFPGLPVFHSTDLVSWRRIGHCLTRPEQVDLSSVPTSGGIWAPTIRHHDGVFYVVTTVMHVAGFTNELDEDGRFAGARLAGRHLLLTATDPAGPWSDPVWVDGDGLDPSLLFDDDGQVLVTHAEAGVILRAPSTRPAAPGRRTPGRSGPAPRRRPARARTSTTSTGRTTCSWRREAPATGTRRRWPGAAARGAPGSPTPDNPVLSHRTLDGHPVQATGHGDLVQDADGRWWIVFLGIRPRGYPSFHTLGRETFLAPVRWQDGWPYVEGPVELEVAAGPAQQDRGPGTWRDDFTTGPLDGRWNTVRGPDAGVLAGGGRLVLRPSAPGLPPGHRAFVGTRQTEAVCRAEAELVLRPLVDGDVAGLSVRMDDRHSYDVGVEQVDGGVVARLRRRVGSLVADGPHVPVPAGARPAAGRCRGVPVLVLAPRAGRVRGRPARPRGGAVPVLGGGRRLHGGLPRAVRRRVRRGRGQLVRAGGGRSRLSLDPAAPRGRCGSARCAAPQRQTSRPRCPVSVDCSCPRRAAGHPAADGLERRP